MSAREWWKGTLRVIQDNLQVADTPLMDAEKIARETAEMHANVLVINVGGIYAWYQSQVPYHHINEYLPKDHDLLADLISACHARDIKLVARFDFSKTHDYVSQEHPEWFVRESDGSPRSYGATRPGNWSILYATCINSGYRNEEVAVPALREVLDRYAIDGIFLNAPNYEYCCCEVCKQKYQALYGKPLPLEAPGSTPALEKTFAGICYRDNIGRLYQAIQEAAPQVPLILYYSTHNENLSDRLQTSDMLCTEAQDVLSRGQDDIPPIWTPTINMKMGRAQPEGNPPPFGIIHSCPGMDWRHTGLPQAEYRFWLRQVPAAGGTIWHSVTGFNDTIRDKRIIDAVSDVNAEIAVIEGDMDGAKEFSDVLLLWNGHETGGWAQLLVDTQTQFDIRDPYALAPEVLRRYPMVILPDRYPLTDSIAQMLHAYVQDGGKLLVEGTSAAQLLPFAEMLGIQKDIRQSESMTASYLQFEPAGDTVRAGLEQVPIIAHRGVTAYTRVLPGTQVLATLIPPFAPLSAVGSPPERASMLVKHTDIPLLTLNAYGKGQAAMLPFALSTLAKSFHLAEHDLLFANIADLLLGGRAFRMSAPRGVVASVFQKENSLLIHLVNGVGQRPLSSNVPLQNLTVTLRLSRKVTSAVSTLEGNDIQCLTDGNITTLKLSGLKLWDMLRLTLE